VIYPPVDTDHFRPMPAVVRGFYLCVGQLIPYKQVALAIEACNRLRRQLVIVGDGKQRAELMRLAGPTIRFVGRPTDDELREYYGQCHALIFAGEEDFGIVPLEAMASGRPVIAYGRGGALETVIPGETGVLFDQQTPEALMEAMERFEKTRASFDPDRIAAHASRFARDCFKRAMEAVVLKAIGDRRQDLPMVTAPHPGDQVAAA
jgi:glycosyltransferase involved in cell wall biosynthesis